MGLRRRCAVLACGAVLVACNSSDKWSDVRDRVARNTPPLSVPAPTAEPEAPAPPPPTAKADDQTAPAPHRNSSPPSRRRARGTASATSNAAGAARDRGDADDSDASDASFRVSRLVLSSGVSGREPVGVATSFRGSAVDRIFAFVELANDGREPGEIAVAFVSPAGVTVHKATLAVGADRRWRTWAFTHRPKTPGTWSAVVTSSSGRVLARASFEITP